LRQDPGLDWTPPPQEPGPSPGETGGPAGEAGRVLAASVPRSSQAADELVGRDDQLAALDAVLAGARGGHGRVVLVAGEPGIGKTRLAEPAPPPGPPPVADLGAARFQLNQAVAGLLRRLAEARPLLIVVDDLHWADVPSLSLLAFLAAELNDARLVVVGTYRDVEVVAGRALAETLGALAREPVVERIALGGLDRVGVTRLIGRTIGARPAEPLVAAVADRCGGNPFFITELLRLLQSERRLAAPDATAAARHDIPVGVRDVLRRRLARLPAQTSTFLMVAAVAGRGFSLDLIEAVTGLEDEPALDAAEAAVLAGLVIEDDRAAGRYRFAHALVRETIYEDISRARRARLHARVVDGLVATRGPEPGPAAEMAYHCWQAASVIGAARALPHLLRAGEQAVAQLAYEAADEQFERALELAGQLPASPQAAEQEIHIAARLGTVRLVMRGYADPDAAQALARPGRWQFGQAGGASRPTAGGRCSCATWSAPNSGPPRNSALSWWHWAVNATTRPSCRPATGRRGPWPCTGGICRKRSTIWSALWRRAGTSPRACQAMPPWS
jgi:hypothetical protein